MVSRALDTALKLNNEGITYRFISKQSINKAKAAQWQFLDCSYLAIFTKLVVL
jgi:hypothetical protein